MTAQDNLEQELEQKKRIRRIAEALLIMTGFAIFAWMLQIHTPKVLKILESGNVTDVENYIQSEGTKGRYILIGLQVVETVSIVLPAIPVYICAGILFGKLQGFLMCYVTNLVLNWLIYQAAKKMHTRTEEFSKAGQNKTLEKLMKLTDKPIPLVMIMCLVPVIPSGTIPYVCAQSGIKLSQFMEGIALGSLPAILLYVCCGDLLISVHYRKILPILLVLAVGVVLALIFRKQITARIAWRFSARAETSQI